MSTMRKTKGSGVMPAVMTFWNADESFNQKETERYVQWVLDCGAHSLSVTGSTGENISMSDDEQKKIIECLVKFVDHQVPIYPGTGRYGTAQTIEMTKFAQKCGAEGALVIMPYYLIPHKRAVVNHFKKLREAVGDVLGANFDPSHLIWQGIEPVAAIRKLGDAIYHVHAKDTKLDKYNIAADGVLDTKHYSDEIHRSWVFRSVGYGNGEQYWRDLISALRLVGYDRVLSIEHEDSLMSIDEGLKKAVEFLRPSVINEPKPTTMGWA